MSRESSIDLLCGCLWSDGAGNSVLFTPYFGVNKISRLVLQRLLMARAGFVWMGLFPKSAQMRGSRPQIFHP